MRSVKRCWLIPRQGIARDVRGWPRDDENRSAAHTSGRTNTCYIIPHRTGLNAFGSLKTQCSTNPSQKLIVVEHFSSSALFSWAQRVNESWTQSSDSCCEIIRFGSDQAVPPLLCDSFSSTTGSPHARFWQATVQRQPGIYREEDPVQKTFLVLSSPIQRIAPIIVDNLKNIHAILHERHVVCL